MLTISLHPNDHTVLEKATQMVVSFARISLQEPHFFWKQKHDFEIHAHNKCHCFKNKSIY